MHGSGGWEGKEKDKKEDDVDNDRLSCHVVMNLNLVRAHCTPLSASSQRRTRGSSKHI